MMMPDYHKMSSQKLCCATKFPLPRRREATFVIATHREWDHDFLVWAAHQLTASTDDTEIGASKP